MLNSKFYDQKFYIVDVTRFVLLTILRISVKGNFLLLLRIKQYCVANYHVRYKCGVTTSVLVYVFR